MTWGRRLWWLVGHAACAAACLTTWRLAVSQASPLPPAEPPPARWVLERRSDRTLWVRDLSSRQEIPAPNPLPRLGPLALAPGFNPNFWALADSHRIKIISLQTGEAVASFEAPLGGVDRLCWLDEDRLAVVAKDNNPWLIHQLSTGKRYHFGAVSSEYLSP